MIAEERIAFETPSPVRPERQLRPVLETSPTAAATGPPERSIVGRLLLVGVGFAIASAGFMLMLSVFLVFIGLPMFIFGLAVMQAQET